MDSVCKALVAGSGTRAVQMEMEHQCQRCARIPFLPAGPWEAQRDLRSPPSPAAVCRDNWPPAAKHHLHLFLLQHGKDDGTDVPAAPALVYVMHN